MTDESEAETTDEAADSPRPSRFKRFLDATDPTTEPTDTASETEDTPAASRSSDPTDSRGDESVTDAADNVSQETPSARSDVTDPPQQPEDATQQPDESPTKSDQSSPTPSEPPREQSVDEWQWLADPTESDQPADTAASTPASNDPPSATDDEELVVEDSEPAATADEPAATDETETGASSPGPPSEESPSPAATEAASTAQAPSTTEDAGSESSDTATADQAEPAPDSPFADAHAATPSNPDTPADTSTTPSRESSQDTTTGDTASDTESGRNRSQRVWNSVDTTTTAERSTSPTTPAADSATDSAAPSEDTPPAASDLSHQESDTAAERTPVEIDPGESAFILSPTHSDARQQLVRDVVATFETAPVLVVVRYRPLPEALLRDLAELTHQLEVVSVGYSQSLPPAVEPQVSTTHITSASDVTRLGIVVSQLVDADYGTPRPTVFHHHAVDTLLQYRDPNTTFRFFHVLLGRLRNAEFTNHFFIDAAAVDDHAVSSLRPLFDTVVDTT